MMTKKLGDFDAQAVDLLLDRSNQVGGSKGNGGSSVYVTPVGDNVARRVGAVESVLRLVAEMPAEEPPADLFDRTMQRIQQRQAAPGMMAPANVPSHHPPHPAIGHGPRHA